MWSKLSLIELYQICKKSEFLQIRFVSLRREKIRNSNCKCGQGCLSGDTDSCVHVKHSNTRHTDKLLLPCYPLCSLFLSLVLISCSLCCHGCQSSALTRPDSSTDMLCIGHTHTAPTLPAGPCPAQHEVFDTSSTLSHLILSNIVFLWKRLESTQGFTGCFSKNVCPQWNTWALWTWLNLFFFVLF